jgi:3-hydroxyacyl-[acyl-carrier-protein] dehydratase
MADLEEALALLPHGREFRFLDRLTQLEPGRSGAGEYWVDPGHPLLRGHFPGEPIWPGVLLLEGAAQLGGVVAQSDPVQGALPGLKLTAMRGVKILGAVRPGERVLYEATVLGRMANLVQVRVNGRVDGVSVLEGDLVLSGA